MSGASLQVSGNGIRMTLLVFRVADQKYALSSSDVAEILPMAELQRPPGAPQLLAGFLDLAGELVPVIRLHHLFGLPDQSTQLWTPLIIVRESGRRLGLLVDAVDRTLTVREDAILPLPRTHVSNECAVGIVRSSDTAMSLLSPQSLLLDQEKRALAEIQRMTQQRVDEVEGIEP